MDNLRRDSQNLCCRSQNWRRGTKGISSFLVQDGMEGFSYGKKESKMGWRVSPTRELIFENCFIPDENILQRRHWL